MTPGCRAPELRPARWCSSIPLPHGSAVNACWRPVVPTSTGSLTWRPRAAARRPRRPGRRRRGRSAGPRCRAPRPRSDGPAAVRGVEPGAGEPEVGASEVLHQADLLGVERDAAGTSGTLMATWSTPVGATWMGHGERAYDVADDGGHGGHGSGPTRRSSADVDGGSAAAAGLVTRAKPRTSAPGLAGGDGLERHGHADHVGAQRCAASGSRPGSRTGARQLGVDAGSRGRAPMAAGPAWREARPRSVGA